VAELKKIWEPNSTVSNWSQIRPGFPNRPLKLYGAGTDSGTFDYFTDAIVGEEGASRNDYTASEDDNTLVTGVGGDPGALGYFGYAYYEQNQDKLKVLGVGKDAGSAVKPSPETIQNGTYQPLSRPLFLYVSKSAMSRPEVQAYVSSCSVTGARLSRTWGTCRCPTAPTNWRRRGPTRARPAPYSAAVRRSASRSRTCSARKARSSGDAPFVFVVGSAAQR
jgi:phosphate transport system substrate-binding protein